MPEKFSIKTLLNITMPETCKQIERFVFEPIRSNMYIIVERGEAIVVDPHVSPDALKYMHDRSVRSLIILLTHEHFDHTSGVNWLKDNFNTLLTCSEACATRIALKRNNRPLTLPYLKPDNSTDLIAQSAWYECFADITFKREHSFCWRGHDFHMVATPGHTIGSCCIELDKKYVFTGDSLIADAKTITRFPTGNQEDYEKFTLPYLQAISSDNWILPGHGRPFQMKNVLYSDDYFRSIESIPGIVKRV